MQIGVRLKGGSLYFATICTFLTIGLNGCTSITPLVIGQNIGMWVWDRENIVNPLQRKHLLNFCRKYGINHIFIQPHLIQKEEGYYLADQEALSIFLRSANFLNIKVDILEGSAYLGLAKNRNDTLARLRGIMKFQANQSRDARFSGIHYNIELHVTERWQMGQEKAVALEFLETMYEVRKLISNSGQSLTLANDIPFWYDHDDYYFKFNGSMKYLSEHIQDLSDFVCVLSYRTNVSGPDSITYIARDELAYGSKINRLVYLSIETAPVPNSPRITFHGREPNNIIYTLHKLMGIYGNTSSFAGISLHEYKFINEMSKQWNPKAISKLAKWSNK